MLPYSHLVKYHHLYSRTLYSNVRGQDVHNVCTVYKGAATEDFSCVPVSTSSTEVALFSVLSIWATYRKIPIDMAGFAINLHLLLTRPEVWIGRNSDGRDSKVGQLETDFLEHFTTRETVECRGLNSEVLLHHYPWLHSQQMHNTL